MNDMTIQFKVICNTASTTKISIINSLVPKCVFENKCPFSQVSSGLTIKCTVSVNTYDDDDNVFVRPIIKKIIINGSVPDNVPHLTGPNIRCSSHFVVS